MEDDRLAAGDNCPAAGYNGLGYRCGPGADPVDDPDDPAGDPGGPVGDPGDPGEVPGVQEVKTDVLEEVPDAVGAGLDDAMAAGAVG